MWQLGNSTNSKTLQELDLGVGEESFYAGIEWGVNTSVRDIWIGIS